MPAASWPPTSLASSAFAATHFSAAAGALAWAAHGMDHARQAERPGRLLGCRGRPGLHHAGRRLRQSDAGAAHRAWRRASSASGLHVAEVEFGYDDSLDAFGVHGVGGTLGAMLTGVFATRACWNIDNGQPLGLIEGGTHAWSGRSWPSWSPGCLPPWSRSSC